MNILITGASSGIGQACRDLLSQQHQVHAPTRAELDLSNFGAIDSLDVSRYDVIINAAGANVGAHLGWQNNSWQNQAQQVDVNFTGALLLAKQYTRQRSQGQFVYVTSLNVDDPIAYNIFYTAAKAALRYSMATLRRDCPGIVFSEICPGKTRTNMLAQNYQGLKTQDEIQAMYAKGPVKQPEDIAVMIDLAIKYKLDHITISPHDT